MFTLVTVAAVFMVLLLSLGAYVWRRTSLTSGDVPLLKTPAWEFQALEESDDQLMLRRDTEAGGALLLKRSGLETVYRYDPQTRSVSAVTDAAWQKATGQISKCREQQYTAHLSGLMSNEREHKLFAGAREVPTAGGIPLNDQTSPSGKWAAVVSAAGPAVPSILPFTGDLIYGQRYHEILSLPDAIRVGRAVRVPVNDRNDFLEPCWSADEKFVVYTTYFFNLLVVVETGL